MLIPEYILKISEQVERLLKKHSCVIRVSGADTWHARVTLKRVLNLDDKQALHWNGAVLGRISTALKSANTLPRH